MQRKLAPRLRRVRLIIALGVLTGASVALAQDFFRVAPGPLSTPHAKWDDSSKCTACHELGKGVKSPLCLDCHHHEPLKIAIKKGNGLHAGFKQPCITCHTEHKGRTATIVDWRLLGGRQTFDHKRTGFALAGKHTKVPCTGCHKKRLTSGRTSYVGLDEKCDSCHKNPHNFTKNYQERCELCHKPGTVQRMRGTNVAFDHAGVSIPLKGKHARIACTACHKKADMRSREPPRRCPDCHQKHPHGQNPRFEKCVQCHAPQRPWKKVTFDHDLTKLPLKGKHAKIDCKACHKQKKKTPSPDCGSCHDDPHKKRFAKLACPDCHGDGGMTKNVSLDHGKATKFPLVGAHRRADCRACHRGKKPNEFEKLKPECKTCHQHAKAHNGQFGDKRCLDCHGDGGSKKLVFDHSAEDARFRLTGFHQRLAKRHRCRACHKPPGNYRTGKAACRDCHKDFHEGALGDDCKRCHSTEVNFDKLEFDHNNLSPFKLAGTHAKQKCEKCHPKRQFRHGEPRACIDCHEKNDRHKGRLGKECGKCHEPVVGAPRFNHDTMTRFVRAGRHKEVACGFCHRAPVTPPPKVGWTRGQTAPEKVDPAFPVMGHRCAECHFDSHGGRYGNACDSCHVSTSFKDVKGALHDTGGFRLAGIHDQVKCESCHTENALLAGTGELCQGCHLEDDAHNNGLGPLCGECHGQWEWTPARFHHGSTGFLLRGAHRIARCEGCHGAGTYAGTPTDCDVCHLHETAALIDPPHTAELAECELCHSEVAFVPARQYHPTYTLTGAHVTLRCRDCHSGGTFAGTVDQCVGCHWAQYVDPANGRDHVAGGFSTDCEECHTTNAWLPATP